MDIVTIIVSKLLGKLLDKYFERLPGLISKIWSFNGFSRMNIVNSLPPTSDCFVFVYGSMLNSKNLHRTINMRAKEIIYLPASLNNYKFEWNAPHKKNNLVIKNNKDLVSLQLEDEWVSLTIKHTGRSEDIVEGAIITVSPRSLQQLKYREKNYTFVENVLANLDNVSQKNIPANIKVSTFVYDKPSLNDNYKTYFLRKDYYTQILKARRALKYRGSIIPPNYIKMRDVYYCDNEVQKVWESKKEIILKQETSQLYDYLYRGNCNRRVGDDKAPIPSALRPYCMDRHTYKQIASLSEEAIKINSLVYRNITKHKNIFQEAGFSSNDLQLTDTNLANFREQPMISRVDLLLRGNSIKLMEINTDSPGGMFHYDMLLTKQLTACDQAGLEIAFPKEFSLCQTICDTILDNWEIYCRRKSKDVQSIENIIILECNPQNQPTYSEFIHFTTELKTRAEKKYKKIVDVEIVTPDELDYTSGQLVYKRNKNIDLIYKRALWKELNNVKNNALTEAYLNNDICIVNSLDSRNIGNKFITALLHSDYYLNKYLYPSISEEEKILLEKHRKFYPETKLWSEKGEFCMSNNDINKVFKKPVNFVFKSYQGHGSKEVKIGRKMDNPDETLIDLLKENRFVVQEFVPHGIADFPIIINNNSYEWLHSYFIIGAYVIDSKCVAMEVKLGKDLPISINREGCYRTTALPLS